MKSLHFLQSQHRSNWRSRSVFNLSGNFLTLFWNLWFNFSRSQVKNIDRQADLPKSAYLSTHKFSHTKLHLILSLTVDWYWKHNVQFSDLVMVIFQLRVITIFQFSKFRSIYFFGVKVHTDTNLFVWYRQYFIYPLNWSRLNRFERIWNLKMGC